MNLAFSDFCLMLALFPEMVYNFFLGGNWQFGETACQIHAFLGSVFGYSQIFTLTFISWDRYNVIVQAVFKHEDELRQQAKKMNVASLRSHTEQQGQSAEIKIAKVAILNVSLWTLAWTPFTVICMLGTWGDVSKITPLVSAIPVIIAKTSCCYNPIIYAISHPKYRECLKEMYPSMCITPEKEVAPARDNASEATQDQTA